MNFRFDEEEIINNLTDRVFNLRDIELVSAIEDKKQEMLNEELTGLYVLYIVKNQMKKVNNGCPK